MQRLRTLVPSMPKLAKPVGLSIAALAGVALLMALLAATVEIRIPLDSQRERIAQALSEALKSPVEISGPLNFHTGPRAGFDAAGLRVGAPGGAGPVTAQFDRLELRLTPTALLRRELRIVDATAQDLQICVDPASLAASRADRTTSEQTGWRLVEIGRLQLQRLRIDTTPDCASDEGSVQIAQLDLRAPQGAPLHLSARGRIEGEQGSLEFVGPSLAALLSDVPAAQAFELDARYAGATVSLRGEVDVARRSGRADVGFEAPELAQLLRPFMAVMSQLGPLTMRAHVDATASAVTLRVHEATLRPVQLSAKAAVTWSGPRPSVILHAQTDRLDAAALRDWLASATVPAPRDRNRTGGEFTRRFATALRASDGRVAINVGQFDAGPVELTGLALDGAWDGGDVKATVKALWEASPVQGTWSADLRRDPYEFVMVAEARRLRVPPRLGLKGSFDAVEARLNGRGTLGAGPPTEVRATVGSRAARLTVPTGRGDTMELTLGGVQAQWRERGTATLEASGSMAGERFRVRVDGADTTALWQQRPWTFSARGDVGPLQGKAQGTLALLAGQVEARFDVGAQAERLGTLARGYAGLAALPFEAQAGVSLGQREWSADLRRLRLGQTLARATAQGSLQGPPQPLRAELRFDTLDAVELVGSGAAAAPDGAALPQRLVLPAADIDVRATRARLPGLTLEELIASGSIRDGKLVPSTFAFKLDGATIEGTAAVDLTGTSAELSAKAKATGITERHLGPALANKGIRFKAGDVVLSAASSGSQVRDLLANTEAQLSVRQASFVVQGPDRTSQRSGNVTSARLSVAPGQPAAVELAGDWEGVPVKLEGRSVALPELLPVADTPIRINARVADIDVDIQGHVQGSHPQARPLNIRVRTQTLDQFEAITSFDLPSTGPFGFDLTLRDAGTDQPSADFALTLGQSELEGQLSVQSGGDRPRWEVELKAPRLRLEDLGSADWALEESPTAPKTERAAAKAATAADARTRQAQMISDEVARALRRFDARVHLAIEKVSSGTHEFGQVEADALLESGRLRLGPVGLAGPMGRFALTANTDFAAAETPFTIDFALEQFDYGRLVRSIRPNVDTTGELSLHLHLAGHGRVGEQIPTLNGRLGLIVFPVSTPGLRVLDLWGAGLLRNLEAALVPGQQTRVNCGVATFGIAAGVLKSQSLMLDATSVRIAGELEVDLARATLNGLIMPKSKRAQLVSLEVPMSIGGTLSDPVIRPAAGAFALATARSFYVAYKYLYDVATSGALAADGRPDCVAAYEKLVQ